MISSSFDDAYQAARQRSASIARLDHAWIVVSGKDRAEYLQGLLTNDVVALKAGEGCYAAYLTPQGRMISDMHVYELGDVMLLALPAAVRQTVLARLDQFIFSEDVQLGDVSDSFAGVSVVGPDAAATVARALSVDRGAVDALPVHGNLRTTFGGSPCIVLRVVDRGEGGFDLLIETVLRERLHAALDAAGAVRVDQQVADTLRVEGGVPLFHRDMTEETIPLEAGIESRAISFSKGCYVGQEVIIRVLHRGHGRVARKLVGLLLSGEGVPVTGAAVEAESRAIGAITSAVWSPRLQRPIAMAYVHRDFIAPGSAVRVGDHEATVTSLPFHQ